MSKQLTKLCKLIKHCPRESGRIKELVLPLKGTASEVKVYVEPASPDWSEHMMLSKLPPLFKLNQNKEFEDGVIALTALVAETYPVKGYGFYNSKLKILLEMPYGNRPALVFMYLCVN